MTKSYYRHCDELWVGVSTFREHDECPKCKEEIEPYKSQELEDVELIASGYEWYCPECEEFNNEIEIPYYLVCRKCGGSFGVGDYHHALN